MRRPVVFGLLALAVVLEPLLFSSGVGSAGLALSALPLVMFALALGGAYGNPSLRRGVVPAALLLILLVLFAGNTGVTVNGSAPEGRSAGHVPLPAWVGDDGAYLLSSLASLAGIAAIGALLFLAQPPPQGTRWVMLAIGGISALSLAFANIGRAYNTFTPSWAMVLDVVGSAGIIAVHVLVALALVVFALRSRGNEGNLVRAEATMTP